MNSSGYELLFFSQSIVVEKYLNLRYDGTDCALMCTSNEDTADSFVNVFTKKYGHDDSAERRQLVS